MVSRENSIKTSWCHDNVDVGKYYVDIDYFSVEFLSESEAPDVSIVSRVPAVQAGPGPVLQLPPDGGVEAALEHAAHHGHTAGPGTRHLHPPILESRLRS